MKVRYVIAIEKQHTTTTFVGQQITHISRQYLHWNPARPFIDGTPNASCWHWTLEMATRFRKPVDAAAVLLRFDDGAIVMRLEEPNGKHIVRYMTEEDYA